MASKTTGKGHRRQQVPPRAAQRAVDRARPTPTRRRRWTWLWVALIIVAVVGALYLIYRSSAGGDPAAQGEGSGLRHVAGQPGAGAVAPAFTLASSTGGQVSLADYRGRNVLLYFQEGLGCQPCWDQIRDLEQTQAALRDAGVDAVVSITTDPADLVKQKVTDERLSTPVLSDPTLQVSRAYTTNQYGMMGTSRNGHTFILVGVDGVIRWRADYGGKPDYTMFVPTDKMLADLAKERLR